jgi:hypothetical protein
MKALIIIVILATIAIMLFQYTRNKNLIKLFIAFATFALIITFLVVGNVTRPILPIFIAHIILIIVSWGGLIVYLVKERYYWWIIFSPAVTIGLFLVLEFFAGSGNEIG